MKILVINTGSSSIKYQVFQMRNKSVLVSGMLEKIGETESKLIQKKYSGNKNERALIKKIHIKDHQDGLSYIIELLTDPKVGVIRDKSEIDAVGHRVVHGGEIFTESTLIDKRVIKAIEKQIPLAPLHNPANLIGIQVAGKFFSDIPHIAVFDTAFHHTIPPFAYHYAIPYKLYKAHKIRRYGFHGTSHNYVAEETAGFIKRPINKINIITIHLGNGASISAIKKGKSVDTSMGMTPLEGLMMGTRSGDIDPAIHFFLINHGMSVKDVENLLNKESGLKGYIKSNDMRDLLAKMEKGNKLACLAFDIYTYRIKKYIGAYMAVLGRVGAIVFTAGIGERSPEIRSQVCKGLEHLGIQIDQRKNRSVKNKPVEIQSVKSRVKILVIPTNEELKIAEQTMSVLKSKK